jgi:hypothetical protein
MHVNNLFVNILVEGKSNLFIVKVIIKMAHDVNMQPIMIFSFQCGAKTWVQNTI